MSDEADRGHPAHDSVVELISASRGDTLMSWSEGLHEGDLLVTAPLDQSQRPVSLAVGEHLEVVWRGADGLRALPVVLTAAESGERSRWRLSSVGVVRRGQRRDAVRAPLTIPVRIGPEPTPVTGTTLDVSEGGLRCVLDKAQQPTRVPPDGDGAAGPSPARVGDVVRVAALFPDFTVTCLAEVTRHHEREDPRLELSLRFIGLTENQEDLIRRRVFARLRELRHRGLL
jgi:PilZ domain